MIEEMHLRLQLIDSARTFQSELDAAYTEHKLNHESAATFLKRAVLLWRDWSALAFASIIDVGDVVSSMADRLRAG